MARGFKVPVRNEKDGRQKALVVKGFIYFEDANGVYWKRTVELDGTFSTPENAGSKLPTDGIVVRKA